MLPHRLPSPLQARMEAIAGDLTRVEGMAVDFSSPTGAQALAAPGSVSWRVFKNPIALFIGGVGAVLLELAEPKVRAGVWDHTSFRTDPVMRLRRTGLAAMVTVYAARETAEAMIAGVGRRHARVRGVTEGGAAYAADDPDLLDWVQATASYGFLQGYHRFVAPLSSADRDRFYAEAAPAARLYGALNSPTNEAELEHAFAAMAPRLEPSPVIREFLDIIRGAAVLPAGMRPLQRLLVRAAVDILPVWAFDRLELSRADGLSGWQMPLVQALGRAADHLLLENAPPARACLRLGLPPDWLYRRRAGVPED
jgi:uncharacterized protein (DUF2236 family)